MVKETGLPPDCAAIFELRGILGQGGFGTVYECEHRALRRPAAVKVMNRELAGDGDQLERFVREARVASSIKHPHVVTVLDCGSAQDPWIAFELVRGPTLRVRLEQAGLSIEETLELGIQVSSALEAAHAQGVIHRDVKPENILEREPGHWMLADFGVARAASDSRALTAAGVLIGTPAYMAPEYVISGNLTPHADCYALATLLYEAVTGRLPVTGETPVDFLDHQVRMVPDRASALRSDVPPRLDALLERALRKRPEERLPDAAALRRALEATRSEAIRSETKRSEAPVSGIGAERPAPAPPGAAPSRSTSRTSPISRAGHAPGNSGTPRGRGRALAAAAACAIALWAVRAAWPPQTGPHVIDRTPASSRPAPLDAGKDPILEEINRTYVLLAACAEDYEMVEVTNGFGGGKVVGNVDKIAPQLATALTHVSRLVEELPTRQTSARYWCWIAHLCHRASESMRYFPLRFDPTNRVGKQCVRIQQAAQRADAASPVRSFTPLCLAALTCVTEPSSRSERQAADQCEAAVRELEGPDLAGWNGRCERTSYLLALTWRQLDHQRRSPKLPGEPLVAERRRLLERGLRLGEELAATDAETLVATTGGVGALNVCLSMLDELDRSTSLGWTRTDELRRVLELLGGALDRLPAGLAHKDVLAVRTALAGRLGSRAAPSPR